MTLPAETMLSELRRLAEAAISEEFIPCISARQLLALVECAEVLATVPEIAAEAREAWDNDNDSRVGKMLIAMGGGIPNYRADIERIHTALEKLEAL